MSAIGIQSHDVKAKIKDIMVFKIIAIGNNIKATIIPAKKNLIKYTSKRFQSLEKFFPKKPVSGLLSNLSRDLCMPESTFPN